MDANLFENDNRAESTQILAEIVNNCFLHERVYAEFVKVAQRRRQRCVQINQPWELF